MDKKIKETLKKAQDWELEIWSEESGYDYVEIYLDDVVDIIDSIKFLEKENKRYREALEHIKEWSDDKVAVFIAKINLEGEE